MPNDGEHVHATDVTILTRRLADALRARGFSAEPFGANLVWVANRAADPRVAGARLSPGLRQTVLCGPDGDGRLGWSWVWTAANGRPEYEWFCAADRMPAAVDAIARVLALRPE